MNHLTPSSAQPCDLTYSFSEGGERRERLRERNIDGREKHGSIASHMPPRWDLARNPRLCPDWELNLWPFGLQNDAQSTETHQSGLKVTTGLIPSQGTCVGSFPWVCRRGSQLMFLSHIMFLSRSSSLPLRAASRCSIVS